MRASRHCSPGGRPTTTWTTSRRSWRSCTSHSRGWQPVRYEASASATRACATTWWRPCSSTCFGSVPPEMPRRLPPSTAAGPIPRRPSIRAGRSSAASRGRGPTMRHAARGDATGSLPAMRIHPRGRMPRPSMKKSRRSRSMSSVFMQRWLRSTSGRGGSSNSSSTARIRQSSPTCSVCARAPCRDSARRRSDGYGPRWRQRRERERERERNI